MHKCATYETNHYFARVRRRRNRHSRFACKSHSRTHTSCAVLICKRAFFVFVCYSCGPLSAHNYPIHFYEHNGCSRANKIMYFNASEWQMYFEYSVTASSTIDGDDEEEPTAQYHLIIHQLTDKSLHTQYGIVFRMPCNTTIRVKGFPYIYIYIIEPVCCVQYMPSYCVAESVREGQRQAQKRILRESGLSVWAAHYIKRLPYFIDAARIFISFFNRAMPKWSHAVRLPFCCVPALPTSAQRADTRTRTHTHTLLRRYE